MFSSTNTVFVVVCLVVACSWASAGDDDITAEQKAHFESCVEKYGVRLSVLIERGRPDVPRSVLNCLSACAMKMFNDGKLDTTEMKAITETREESKIKESMKEIIDVCEEKLKEETFEDECGVGDKFFKCKFEEVRKRGVGRMEKPAEDQ